MSGQPLHHQWRKEIEAGTLLGPRMVVASQIVDGPTPLWPGSISVANESQARQAVDQAKQAGADFIKVYTFLPRDAYFAIADEAKKQRIPYERRVPLSVTAEEASRAGQKSFEHLTGILPACSTRSEELTEAARADLAEDVASTPTFWGLHLHGLRQAMIDTYSPKKAATLFALLKNNGTWQCPTLTLLRALAFGKDPSFADVPSREIHAVPGKVRLEPGRPLRRERGGLFSGQERVPERSRGGWTDAAIGRRNPGRHRYPESLLLSWFQLA